MDRLSSCYFCGVAHDESLSEYPVVPRQLHPTENTQRTVVLCSTCRRKLATVVETVVTAARGDEAAEDDPTGATEDETAFEDDQSGLVDESGQDPQPDPMALSDANETVAEDYPEMDLSHDGTTVGEPAETASDASAETAADGTTERTPAEASEAEAETGRAEDSEADRQQALTRLEYSKVMRLLQNREFPVDRSEIRDVAVNAYDIEPEQFDAITELAVERDLIGEENDRFVSPE